MSLTVARVYGQSVISAAQLHDGDRSVGLGGDENERFLSLSPPYVKRAVLEKILVLYLSTCSAMFSKHLSRFRGQC